MKTQHKLLAALALATMVSPPLALAQDSNTTLAAYLPPGEATEASAAGTRAVPNTSYTQQELEQMLAPVALYPDSLLSQIMMAATYPLEVVEAARWARANPNLQGEEAVRAVDQQDWDPSVKSLVAFPQVLAQLDQNLGWTERVGNAFLAQQGQVMQTVQALRTKAQNTGSLASNQQVRVEQQDGNIVVAPTDPQLIYVPYYDPSTVYGPIWSPAFEPVYFAPPYGYSAGYYPRASLYWGPAIFVSAGFFFGGFDWHHHVANIVNTRPFYFHPGYGGRYAAGPGQWQHDPMHRHGIAYRDAGVRQQFGRPAMAANMARPFNAGMTPRGMNQQAAPAQFRAAEPPRQAVQGRPQTQPQFHSQERSQYRPNLSYSGVSPVTRSRGFESAAHYANQNQNASRPVMMASVSSAHYSAPAHSSGGGGGGQNGGGHGGGGHSGGGHEGGHR